jgi:hypothetical protein
MSCPFPGGEPLLNCSATSVVLPAQWAAMQAICIILPSLGLVLALLLLWEHFSKRAGAPGPQSSLSLNRLKASAVVINSDTVGLVVMIVCEVCLIIYYAVDPGFSRAVASGYFSPSYAGGMLSLVLVGAVGLSGCATSVLVGFWLSVRSVGGTRVLGTLTPRAGVVTLLICAWFVCFTVLASVAVAHFSQAAFLALSGLSALMTVVTAVVVPIAGELVIRDIQRAGKFKLMPERDMSTLRSIRM